MQADYKNRADLIWKKSIYQYHAYYILPSQASLKSLITWTGTAQRVLTCISKDMCQVCSMVSVNINIPLCSLKPHHSSFIFVRKKTQPLFLMALFTAVSKSLNYCDFFNFIIVSPASHFKLFKSIFSQSNANRAQRQGIRCEAEFKQNHVNEKFK